MYIYISSQDTRQGFWLSQTLVMITCPIRHKASDDRSILTETVKDGQMIPVTGHSVAGSVRRELKNESSRPGLAWTGGPGYTLGAQGTERSCKLIKHCKETTSKTEHLPRPSIILPQLIYPKRFRHSSAELNLYA